MGELLTQLRKENMQAMKDKDTLKKGVLSLLISAIALGEKEKGETLSKEDELTYVQKELKQTSSWGSRDKCMGNVTPVRQETREKEEKKQASAPEQSVGSAPAQLCD